jgi:GntR family colanic acid and biofilm gene transcriptional regulator
MEARAAAANTAGHLKTAIRMAASASTIRKRGEGTSRGSLASASSEAVCYQGMEIHGAKTRMKKRKETRGRKQSESPQLGSLDPDSEESVERQVYRLIKEALMAGLLAPGSAITGRSIANGLGISPTPVRDALKRLEADGVIEGRNKSAYFVKELSREQYIDILNVRTEIECYAVGLAAKVATPADVNDLEVVNAKYVVAKNMTESIRLNYLFHFGIYKLARSDVLLDVISNLWVRIGPCMHLYLQSCRVSDVVNNHARIVAALKRDDPEAAATALRKDLNEATKVIAPRLPTTAASSAPVAAS